MQTRIGEQEEAAAHQLISPASMAACKFATAAAAAADKNCQVQCYKPAGQQDGSFPAFTHRGVDSVAATQIPVLKTVGRAERFGLVAWAAD